MSRLQNALVNTFFEFCVRLYLALFPFVMRTVMLHTIGIGYLGLNGLFTSVLQILSISELGITSAIVYSMYEPVAKQDNKKLCAILRLYRIVYGLIGLAVFLLGTAMIPFLPKLISSDVPPDINIYVLYMMYLVSTACSYSFLSYRCSLLQAYQHHYVISKINLVTMTLQFTLQILFLLLFRNYYIYIVTQFAVQLVNQIAVYLAAKRRYPELSPKGTIDKQMTKDIFRKVKGLFCGKISGIILTSSDTVIISMFLGLTTLAIYQNYFFIVTAVIGFLSSITTGSMAGIGNSLITETVEKNYLSFRRFTFLIAWIVTVCTNCFLVLFQPFMEIWMGLDKMLPMSMVIWFCLYFFVFEYNQLLNTYRDCAGLWHEDQLRPLVMALVNLLLNLFLVRHIGLYGIIASTVVSILFVGTPWLLHKLFHLVFHRSMAEYLTDLAKYTAVTVISCAISYCITRFLNCSGLIALILNGLVAVCIPTVLYLILFRKNENFGDTLLLARGLLSRSGKRK
jgi:O-antigen/teichoic acid export membrane protein